jgi:hypothetical protein
VVGLRGYWIPPLAFPVANLMRLAAAAVNPDPFEREQFFQSDLGVPYAVEGSNIPLENILQLASPLENGQLPPWKAHQWSDNTMGVDVGYRKHWKVSGTGPDGVRYIRAVGHADEWAEIDQLMRHFRIRRCVVDAQPDLDAAKLFSQRWPGRVLRAFYPGPTALKGQLWHVDGLDLKKLKNRKTKTRVDVVNINRTMAMDRVRAMVTKIAEPAPLSVVNDPLFQAHLQATTRVTTPDVRGQHVAMWQNQGDDHMFHAMVYDLIARETMPASTPIFRAAAAGVRTQLEAPALPGGPQRQAPTAPPPTRRRSQVLREVLAGARAAQIQRQVGSPYGPRPGRRDGVI